jgi:hypothetical protein
MPLTCADTALTCSRRSLCVGCSACPENEQHRISYPMTFASSKPASPMSPSQYVNREPFQARLSSAARGCASGATKRSLARRIGELERLSETRGGTGLVRAAHFDRLFVYVVRVAVSITAGATMRARTTERLDSMRDGRESDRFSSRVSGEAAGALGRRRGVVPGRACVPRAVRQPARGDGWRAIAPPRSASGPGRIRRGCRRLL